MYNSLQLSWNRRFSHGLHVRYCLHVLQEHGRRVGPARHHPQHLQRRATCGACPISTCTHVFIANYSYELPFFKNANNLSGKLLGGWQLSGITQFQTGTPCSVATSNDYAGVGQDGSFNCGGQMWIKNGDPTILHQIALNGASDAKYWFPTTDSNGNLLFSQPAKGTFNNLPGARNTIHNPGFENWNMGLFKKFAITEKTGLQFRAEAFNVFNHPNWGGASFNPTNLSTFGKITGKTGDVRNMQFSLRLYF